MMNRIAALPILCLFFLFVLADVSVAQRSFRSIPERSSGGPLSPEQAAYDVLFYDLALRVEPANEFIDGTLTLVADVVWPMDRLVLDLDDALVVHRARDLSSETSEQLDFRHSDGRLVVELRRTLQSGEKLSVAVDYSGQPRVAPRPPWLGGFTWSKTREGMPWVGVSCQMDGADLWWPTKDHPSDEPDSVALHIRVPDPLVVASNGRLRGTESHEDSTTTYHWFVSTPINNYNVTLNIAPYEEISGMYESVTGESFPMSFWVLPERLEDGKRQFDQFQRELRFFEETLGPYPFRIDKYGVAHTPYLGMEHQSIIAYGSTFDKNEFGFDWLHFHELAHEWWGNLVSASDWRDFWIHEGFAVYMEALYAERLNDQEAYHRYLKRLRPRLNNEEAVAPLESKTTGEVYFKRSGRGSDNDIYYKGALILHSLRYLIGKEAIMGVLRRMAYPDPDLETVVDGGQTRLVSTTDLLTLLKERTGEDFTWFADVYLRQPKLPELKQLRDGDRLTLWWKAPNDLPFPMPIDISVDGDVQRVDIKNGRAEVRVGEDAKVEIDPVGWVLRK